MAIQTAMTLARSRSPSACDAAAVERWLGEGGTDVSPEHGHTTTEPETPARDRAREDERASTVERSIDNIDQNATEEALAAQSASDAEDREAESPADEGKEA